MKKILLLALTSMTISSSPAQKVLMDVIDNYYPANPFANKFSIFTFYLLTNDYIAEKTVNKRTDSSLFYFKGEYLMNPFSFVTSRTEVSLAEQEVRFSDMTMKDTLLVYQVIGYSNKSLHDVKNEFSKFEKKYGKKFSTSNYSEITNTEKAIGHTHNFFLKISPISPLSVSWGRMNNHEYAFILTIRFLTRQNEALLPFFANKKRI